MPRDTIRKGDGGGERTQGVRVNPGVWEPGFCVLINAVSNVIH